MFLVIFELIDKLSGSIYGDHEGVDHIIGDRLNIKSHMYPTTPRLSAEMPSHHNFQPGIKVGIKVRLDCICYPNDEWDLISLFLDLD